MRKDGARFWAEATVTALPDLRRNGRTGGYAKVIRDATERRSAEVQREALVREQAARAEAESATRERDQFLDIVAHELRTPLTTIQAPVQLLYGMLREDPEVNVAAALTQRLSQINVQTAKLARMVRALLDFSSIKSGRLEPTRKCGCGSAGAGQGGSGPAADRPACFCAARTRHADHQVEARFRLEQAVTNLLDNAIKYSPNGGQIEVDVSMRPDLVRLCVRDHGLGVPEESRDSLFDEFYRGHQTDHRSGMGIGLYVAAQIIKELHGGRITAEHPVDGGSRFVVVLPDGTSARLVPARSPRCALRLRRVLTPADCAATTWVKLRMFSGGR